MINRINTKLKRMAILLFVCCIVVSGCGDEGGTDINEITEDSNKEYDYYIYCVDEAGTGLTTWGYDMPDKSQSVNDTVSQLLGVFETAPKKDGCASAKSDKLKKMDFDFADGVLKMDIDRNYLKLDSLSQLFFRASIVLTLTQIQEVNYVYMTVNGQPMTDSQGNVIGYMNSESFALYDSSLNSIGTKRFFTLYFANEKGDKLKESRKEYVYDKSQSPEMFALMLLKQGPSEEGLYRTIPENVQIKNVYTKNGICYVNLGSKINELLFEVADVEVMFYSMVNTLTEIDGVTKVQFMIDGDCGEMFRDEIPLDRTYSVNLDIIEK